MSYWMTAFSSWARSGRTRPDLASNVSFTVIVVSSANIEGTGRPCRPPPSVSLLSPLELVLSFLEECLDSLPCVFGPKGLQEGVQLHVHAGVDGPVESPVHAFDDQA